MMLSSQASPALVSCHRPVRRRTPQALRAHKITVLPGDGIGPEITKVALELMEEAGRLEGEKFELKEALIGGAAIDAVGKALPQDTLDACLLSDAVLLAAIGG